jgi:hypothetical protein
LHVLIASNHENVVPAGEKERRYMVQKVAEARQQDEGWFAPIYDQMRDGGLQAMLYDLLDREIGGFAPRRIVRTPALAEQQRESLSPLDEWFLTLLQSGVLNAAPIKPNVAIINTYEEDIEEPTGSGFGKRTRTVKHDGLYDYARRMSPKLKAYSDRKIGDYLADPKRGHCYHDWVKRRRAWKFPPLAECRDRWCERFPGTVWDPESPSEWTSGEDSVTD